MADEESLPTLPVRRGISGRRRDSGRPRPHRHMRDDPDCGVCKHKDRAALEKVYMSFLLKNAQLALLSEVRVEAWNAHVRALGLATERANHTNGVRAYIVNKAFEEGELDKAKMSDVLQILGQIDRHNGVGVQQVDQRPIVIVGVPQPGGRIAPPVKEAPVVEGKVLQLVQQPTPWFSGEAKEEAADEKED